MNRFLLTALILAAGAASPAPARAQSAKPLDSMFDKYDTNGDEHLDAAELAKAFRGKFAKPIEHKETSSKAPEKHADQAFLNAWDADKDGKVSKAEYDKYEEKFAADVKRAQEQMRQMVQRMQQAARNKNRHRGRPRR